MTPQPQAAAPAGKALAPEQMKQMAMFVKQALSVILDDDSARMIVDRSKAGDPKQVTVQAVMPLMQQIYAAASEAGVKVDMVVVLGAGMQVIAMVAKMLESEGILTEEEIPAFAAEVAKIATAQHNESAKAAGGQQAEPAAPPPPTGMIGAPA